MIGLLLSNKTSFKVFESQGNSTLAHENKIKNIKHIFFI